MLPKAWRGGLQTTCGLAMLAVGGAACAAEEQTYEQAQADLARVAEAKRTFYAGLSFAEFKARVYQEPFEDGIYIVNGDTPIYSEKLLREFYERQVRIKPKPRDSGNTEFIIHTVGGLDAVWQPATKRALTYCVSKRRFDERYERVVGDLEAATAAWEQAANVDFIHIASEDLRCGRQNGRVMFDVAPVDVAGEYLARAFFPNAPRKKRRLLIDESSFQLDPADKLKLVGILRHELGHALGARHEHTRPDSGDCFEDDNWRPLTDYDPFSVMHYPQCNGKGDWLLTLTDNDRRGAACVYGRSPTFELELLDCKRGDQVVKRLVFSGENLVGGSEKRYEPLSVRAGTEFRVVMTGAGDNPGDPDLYVKFDEEPFVGLTYDCRPYDDGPAETCDVLVPAGRKLARVMVHANDAARFNLTITYFQSTE